MKSHLALLAALLGQLHFAQAEPAPVAERENNFDAGWHFYRGDAPGAEAPKFDDTQWRMVDLPHDWSIERVPGTDSLFDRKLPQGSGCLPGGIGWYRKDFTLPAETKGQRVYVEFDGVYMDSEVWLNGQKLGNHPYGYTSFDYELTSHLNWGGENVLAVRCNVEQPCSRWFSGAGIYRHVRLAVVDPVHVAHWGTYVTTPAISAASETVRIRTQVQNQGDGAADVTVRTTLLDPKHNPVATGDVVKPIDANGKAEADQKLTVTNPIRWSLDQPQLYTAKTEVLVAGKIKDSYLTPFGIRTEEFTTEQGFLLNGKRVQIKGVCNHHDQGYLGAAAFDRAIERQLEILKSMGCNAIRTSHNPPSPKLLELCDRMGFLVMDEAFDEWLHPKKEFGYSRFFNDWSEPDLLSMIDRDRNHPSVILWSIGNEIEEQRAANGGAMARRLADICHREDPTRPVSAACNRSGDALKTGFAAALDAFGINYTIGAYGTLHDGKNKLYGSETASDVSSRGEYNLVEENGAVVIKAQLKNQVTSYDFCHPPGVIAEESLKSIADAPWFAGEFVWTGFDYIGEPTPSPWPAISSYFGIIDLCGFPKDRYYLYQSRWTDTPMVHILPHWNWPQFAGKKIPVWCYANAETVELFLNGKSLGEKKMAEGAMQKFVSGQRKSKQDGTFVPVEQETGWYHVAWEVPWEPGTLKAVAKRSGQVVATDEVTTAGPPARLALSVDRSKINGDGEDLAYVTVKVVDKSGRVCPDAKNMVKFELAGPGKIAGVGNGDSTCHEDFIASQHTAFHGLCLAILQSAHNQTGTLHLKASAEGLVDAETEIEVAGVGAH